MFDHCECKCVCAAAVRKFEMKLDAFKYDIDERTINTLLWKLRDGDIKFPVEMITAIVNQINLMQLKGQ